MNFILKLFILVFTIYFLLTNISIAKEIEREINIHCEDENKSPFPAKITYYDDKSTIFIWVGNDLDILVNNSYEIVGSTKIGDKTYIHRVFELYSLYPKYEIFETESKLIFNRGKCLRY